MEKTTTDRCHREILNLITQENPDEKINPIPIHGLRHTHASILIQNKISDRYIAKRLGHKDVTQLHKTYGHLLESLESESEEETLDLIKYH